jgi:hypothetical protein
MLASIYQNSFLTIAHTGENDKRGIFRQRHDQLAKPCQVRLEKDLKAFGLRKGGYELVPLSLWDDGVEKTGLLKCRDFVQQRLLSRRVLYILERTSFSGNVMNWYVPLNGSLQLANFCIRTRVRCILSVRHPCSTMLA